MAHGGHDAAAGARDLFVVGALQPLFELARAVAGEHRVGVAVDQPRRDAVAANVARVARKPHGPFGARAGEADDAVAPPKRPVLYHTLSRVPVDRDPLRPP